MATNNETKSPMWVKVNKGDVFTQDVLFATEEELNNCRFSNMIYGVNCKAPDNGYCLSYESLANLPIEN